mgnify:CR=1 FL=1
MVNRRGSSSVLVLLMMVVAMVMTRVDVSRSGCVLKVMISRFALDFGLLSPV